MYKKIFTGTLVILSVVIASIIAFFVADWIKGSNYSDVGIPMYAHSKWALTTGIVIYFLLTFLLLQFIKLWVEKQSEITLMIGLPFTLIYFCFYLFILRFALSL